MRGSGGEKPLNILIVEDNANERSILRSTLERHGCMVIEAADGLEGLDLAIHHQPDIIVSNTLMPRMDGFQLLWAVKADPKLTSIPFLFYSDTYTGEREEKLALSLGAAAFIIKQGTPESVWEQADAATIAAGSRQAATVYPAIDNSDRKHLWEYGRIVATKLEEKVRELEETLSQRKQAVAQLRSLTAELATKVAEHKRAENVIREQERTMSAIFDAAPFPLFLLDGESRIRRVNALASVFTASPASDMIGLRKGEALRCLHALDTPEGCGYGPHCQQCALRLAIRNFLENGREHQRHEMSLPLSVNGRAGDLTLSVSLSRVPTGSQDMIMAGLQDITGQKTMERQLHHAQKMEAVGILVGGIAHECNTNLTTIVGCGDITLAKIPEDITLRRHVKQILNAARRISHLTNDLLVFSKKQCNNKSNIDLNEIIRSTKSFLPQILGQEMVCTTVISERELPIFANAHQIELVMTNLASNARDAAPGGGTLTITTEQTRIDHPFIEAHGFGTPGAYALLTVTDGGAGMDRDTQQRIFEPFFSTKKSTPWSGLGLAVVSQIIRQHDGHISVASEPGRGTTFRIYLPLVPSASKKEGEIAEAAHPSVGSETILLAEDDESVRNMAAAILQHFGYEVILAVDGEDAVRKYHENADKIHLLLFDLVMPRMNGQEAYDEIRKHAPEIKVLFASGHTPEIIRQRRLVGENALLIFKPYLPSIFLQKVRSALNGAQASPVQKSRD
jgi:signal transduction histidine kinase/DNA-binding response OmpR family regulator